MENLLYGIQIVLPIFLIGALGFVLRKIGLLQEAFFTRDFQIPVFCFHSLHAV